MQHRHTISENQTPSGVEITSQCGGYYEDSSDVDTYGTARQYDFSRNWRKKIAPLLNDDDVVSVLALGLRLGDDEYTTGDPPWLYGFPHRRRPREGCLSWYQPKAHCHYIAPFSWALGRKLYPELKWGFITSDRHTVVIGWEADWREPVWVMDILLFQRKTAQQSLAFAQLPGWRFYRSLETYAASFFYDPESALETFRTVVGRITTVQNVRACDHRVEVALAG